MKRTWSHSIPFCMLAVSIFLGGCGGLKAVVIDSSSLQTPVFYFQLEKNDNRLVFLEGHSHRAVEVKKINWIKISPRDVKNLDGKTYYLSEAELKDGSKIMSYRLKDGRKSQAFVCVDDMIMAKTRSGPYRLKLSDATKITFGHH